MTLDEQRAYIELTYRRSPEGSARRIWAAAQLKALNQKSAPAAPAANPPVSRSKR